MFVIFVAEAIGRSHAQCMGSTYSALMSRLRYWTRSCPQSYPLGAGDLLFIDSTHTVKPGSEVNRFVLEVLPRLDEGVLVHFHDIYFPYEYARNFLSGDLFFPGETSLLYAFMLNNPKFRIDLCLSMLHYAAPGAMKKRMPKFEPQGNDAG
jgi:Methyltransferase domain